MRVKRPFDVDPQEMIATLLALAAEGRRPRRVPVKVREARLKARRRRAKARQREAWERVAARRPKRTRTMRPIGERIVDRMTAAMEPGQWYGAKDLARLAGLGDARSAAGKVIQDLWPSGLVERKPNPLWDQHAVISPAELMAGAIREPKWLYRLTAKGEAHREALALLG